MRHQNNLLGGKPALKSVGVWGSIVVVLASGAQLLGYTINADDQATLVKYLDAGVLAVSSLVSLAGGVAALWGRIRATKVINRVK